MVPNELYDAIWKPLSILLTVPAGQKSKSSIVHANTIKEQHSYLHHGFPGCVCMKDLYEDKEKTAHPVEMSRPECRPFMTSVIPKP